jgi:hypothetical protein
MSYQPRVAKVLVSLLLAMTAGAVVLMALGNHAPSAGPFCLSSYYRLSPVQKATTSRAAQLPQRWNSIEIFYSETTGGNVEQLASLAGLQNPDDLNCHFVICSGIGADDGDILPTEKWQRQWSTVQDQNWFGSGQTIRICVVAQTKSLATTDYQVKRTELLTEHLYRKFAVAPENIYYPANWR